MKSLSLIFALLTLSAPALAQTTADPLAHLKAECSRALLTDGALNRMRTVAHIQIDLSLACGYGLAPDAFTCSRQIRSHVRQNFVKECENIRLFCSPEAGQPNPLAAIEIKPGLSVDYVCPNKGR